MFKKLWVMSFSILILVGCNEKKEITENMLIGKWECSMINQEHKSYNLETGELDKITSLDDLVKAGVNTHYIIAYKKENGSINLYANSPNENDSQTMTFMFKVEDLSNDKMSKDVTEDVLAELLGERTYISNDEFKLKNHGVIKNIKKGFLIIEYINDSICTRMK